MRRTLFSFFAALLLVGAAAPANAQAPAAAAEEAAVRAVVKKLFDGMRAADTVMMKSTMAPGMRMFGIGRDGAVSSEGPENWLKGIGSIPPGTVVDEVLHDVEVRVDQNMAMVWTYYDLFVGPNFQHCGYDAMILLKAQGEWKIASVADTRRQQGCRQKRS